MKSTLAFLMVICCVLACSLFSPAKPPVEQTRGALEKFIKQNNPDATVSVLGLEELKSGKFFTIEFAFTDYAFKDDAGEEKTISSGKGWAHYEYSDDTKKWTLKDIQFAHPDLQFFSPNIEIR